MRHTYPNPLTFVALSNGHCAYSTRTVSPVKAVRNMSNLAVVVPVNQISPLWYLLSFAHLTQRALWSLSIAKQEWCACKFPAACSTSFLNSSVGNGPIEK
jgi:hypothetical protein